MNICVCVYVDTYTCVDRLIWRPEGDVTVVFFFFCISLHPSPLYLIHKINLSPNPEIHDLPNLALWLALRILHLPISQMWALQSNSHIHLMFPWVLGTWTPILIHKHFTHWVILPVLCFILVLFFHSTLLQLHGAGKHTHNCAAHTQTHTKARPWILNVPHLRGCWCEHLPIAELWILPNRKSS